MSALLEALSPDAEQMLERVRPHRSSSLTLFGPPGSGKSSVVKAAIEALDAPFVHLRVTDDALGATTALKALIGGLEDLHYSSTSQDPTDDDWPRLMSRAEKSLVLADGDGVVIAVSDADRLERLAGRGGSPGRHADDLLKLLDTSARRLVVTRTLPRRTDRDPLAISRANLADWLGDRSAWGPFADAAAELAGRGVQWTTLPALSLRLAVTLQALGFLPDDPPADPSGFALHLADALVTERACRPAWGAWQILAAVRSPLTEKAIDVLLEDLAIDRSHPVLAHGLLFGGHKGLQMHPAVRTAALPPQGVAATRPLAPSLLQAAGRRGIEHFEQEVASALAEAERGAVALAQSQIVDCVALAGDPDLVRAAGDDLPDPYDHVGQHAGGHVPFAARRAFDTALEIDKADATALRGLADLSDADAEDVKRTERLLRQVLELEPADHTALARLVEVLLAAGRPAAAEGAFDDGWRLAATAPHASEVVEGLLATVAGDAIAHGDFPLAVKAARLAVELEDTPRTRELRQVAEALIEVLEYGEFTTVKRLGTSWWTAPTKLGDHHDGSEMQRWLAGRVDSVDGGVARIHYADVTRPDRRPETRSWLELDVDELAKISEDSVPEPLVGAILEIGLYGPPPEGDEDPDQEVVVRFMPTDEVTLPSSSRSPDRYADAA
jgi:hypothetical protein